MPAFSRSGVNALIRRILLPPFQRNSLLDVAVGKLSSAMIISAEVHLFALRFAPLTWLRQAQHWTQQLHLSCIGWVCMTCMSHIHPGRSHAGFDQIARWFGLKTINSKISPVTELWRSPSPWIEASLRLASYVAILASVGYRDAQTLHKQYDPPHGSGEASAWHNVGGVPSCLSTQLAWAYPVVGLLYPQFASPAKYCLL